MINYFNLGFSSQRAAKCYKTSHSSLPFKANLWWYISKASHICSFFFLNISQHTDKPLLSLMNL